MSCAAKQSASYSERSEHSPIMCPTRKGTGSDQLRGLPTGQVGPSVASRIPSQPPRRWSPGSGRGGGARGGQARARAGTDSGFDRAGRAIQRHCARPTRRWGAGRASGPGPPGRNRPVSRRSAVAWYARRNALRPRSAIRRRRARLWVPLLSPSSVGFGGPFSILHRPDRSVAELAFVCKSVDHGRRRPPHTPFAPPSMGIPAGWGCGTSCRAFLSPKEWPARARSRGFRGISSLHCGIPRTPGPVAPRPARGGAQNALNRRLPMKPTHNVYVPTPSRKAARKVVLPRWSAQRNRRHRQRSGRQHQPATGDQRVRRAGAVRGQRRQLTLARRAAYRPAFS